MGALLIIASVIARKMMMKIFAVIAVAVSVSAIPSPDSVVPEMDLIQTSAIESAHAEAKAAVESMIKAGKDEGACADLAAATIKEVEDAVNGHQKILDSLDTGGDCPQEGQEEVDDANDALDKAKSDKKNADDAAIAAANADVDFAAVAYESLTPGQCADFFSDPAYLAAVSAKEAAEKAATEAAGAVTAAEAALETAKEAQKKAINRCRCRVKVSYDKAWEAANANNEADERAYTKGKHMQCVLAGTPPASCSVGAIPKVKAITLADGVNEASDCPSTFTDPVISYVGCFGDNGARDLKHGPKNYGYTAESCHEQCKDFKYFALQNGGWCNCDNSYSDNYSGSGGKGSYNALSANTCNKDGVWPGRGMGGGWANAIYQLKENDGADYLKEDDFVNWSGSCTTGTVGNGVPERGWVRCNQGNNQVRTKKTYKAPLTVTLEMKQAHGGDECGVFQVFGLKGSRHGHLNAGMGWWTHYLGYGYNTADGHGNSLGKDGTTLKYRQFTISVDSNGHGTFYVDGQKYASKQGSQTEGYISLGMNCRDYIYKDIQVVEGSDKVPF